MLQKQQPYAHVPSEGPLDAKLIILAESPWRNEVESGRPLAGASGNLLKRWWYPLGLERTGMRLMNLFPYRPPTRNIESVPVDKLTEAIDGIHDRIARLQDPYVIVTMGNYATFALTGKGKVKAEVHNAFSALTQGATEAEKKAGITQLRGSIYPYRDKNGRTIKVIPTIHPAAVLQQGKWEKRSIADWKRIQYQAGFRELRDPQRRHIIEPSDTDIINFYQRVASMGSSARLAVDVETWGSVLSCVGFALDPYESLTLPTTKGYESNLGWAKALCETEAQKVLCNGNFDWYWLDAYGIQLRNYILDVQSIHHALDPAESHSLNFLASIYCPHYVFWKDEAKEAEEIIKYAKDATALWVYNGLDCCYTRELVDILEAELIREGMLEFYFRHYVSMFEPLLRTMRHGFRVDIEAQKIAAKQLRGEIEQVHLKLNELAGRELYASETKTKLRGPTDEELIALVTNPPRDENDLTKDGIIRPVYIDRKARQRLIDEHGLTYMISGANAGMIRYKYEKLKKDFSDLKLLEFFYGPEAEGNLGLPKQYETRKTKNGKKRSLSLGEAALWKLMHKHTKAVEPGKLLLEHREKRKELDYFKGAWDKDGRIRCEYTLRTTAGRLSSRKNPMRKGMNLQNLKR